MSRAVGRSLAAVVALGALVLLVLSRPLPASLSTPPEAGTVVLDRSGQRLRALRSSTGELGGAASLAALSPWVVPALLAAEDSRFRVHPGVDPLSVVRAFGQLVREGRIVSGASTLTMQLARLLEPHPRDLGGKLTEMRLALRLEASLSKDRILEEYLGRIDLAPGIRGIEAASRELLDRPASALELADAALLAGLARAPSALDPRRHPERARARRDVVLARMLEQGLAARAEVERALATPVTVHRPRAEGGTSHVAVGLGRGRLLGGLAGASVAAVATTLDARLEREVEALVLGARRGQGAGGPSALAAVVLDNETAEVRAWVGSPDAAHEVDLGANDGVVALRQPGSALKPFVYALAMEELGLTAATLLEDRPLEIETAGGAYRPRNYDRRFHGAVSARQALGSSLNVPAVGLVARLGPERLLEQLRALGMGSLSAPGARYGEALALGDGEVRLLELAGAYATLARGGEYLPPRLVGEVRLASGERRPAPERAAPVRVVEPRVAALITDVLSDDRARAGGFGRDSVLALPFPAAVKTGTSKGHRDNLAVGFTREVTVAVWAGNFDGRPMAGSTGVTGAAPLLREILVAAMRGRAARPLVAPGLLSEAPICPDTGHRAGPRCPEHVTERFVPGTEPALCDHPAHASAEVRGAPRTGSEG